MESPMWSTSSYCDSAACVEVALGVGRSAVRDAKNPGGPMIVFSRLAWDEFIGRVKSGWLDH